jgi:mannose-6-phosphate isomerase-like protein (cupin superfamily)
MARSPPRKAGRGLDERKLAQQLEREGFGHTYVWQDGPNAFYPEHTHDTETAHIILSGEMTLTVGGRTDTYQAGGRCDVPAGTVHSAKMGSMGCRYLIGEG